MTRAVKTIRIAQKEKQFLRTIAELFLQATLDNPGLADLFPSRVSFSPDLGMCTVWFFSSKGSSYFEQQLPLLKLYKPSLRAAVAKSILMRHVPDLQFKYDLSLEKQRRVDDLIEKLKSEGKF